MSSSDEKGCLTLTWEIENFELILEAKEYSELVTIFCVKENTGDSWSRLVVCNYGPYITFGLSYFEGVCWFPEHLTDMTVISTSGEVRMERHFSGSCFSIEKTSIFGNNGPSTILPNSTLTLRCKVCKEAIKDEEFRIHSVLQRVNYLHENSVHSLIKKENILFEIYIVFTEHLHTATATLGGLVGMDSLFSFVDCKISWRECTTWEIRYEYDFLKTKCKVIIEYPDISVCKINLQVNCIVAIHKCHLHQKAHQSSTESVKNASDEVAMYSTTLSKDILHLYKEALHSDATLNADGKSFPVHKNILSTRSEVFRAMFERDRLSEGLSGVVDIDDAHSETVHRMLVYLYGDSLEDLQFEEALDLYYLADKYAVHLLKQKCANILKTGMTTDNACAVLVLANAHSDEKLTERVVDFLGDHQEVMSSSEWQKLEDSHPRLTTKVLREILFKKR